MLGAVSPGRFIRRDGPLDLGHRATLVAVLCQAGPCEGHDLRGNSGRQVEPHWTAPVRRLGGTASPRRFLVQTPPSDPVRRPGDFSDSLWRKAVRSVVPGRRQNLERCPPATNLSSTRRMVKALRQTPAAHRMKLPSVRWPSRRPERWTRCSSAGSGVTLSTGCCAAHLAALQALERTAAPDGPDPFAELLAGDRPRATPGTAGTSADRL